MADAKLSCMSMLFIFVKCTSENFLKQLECRSSTTVALSAKHVQGPLMREAGPPVCCSLQLMIKITLQTSPGSSCSDLTIGQTIDKKQHILEKGKCP